MQRPFVATPTIGIYTSQWVGNFRGGGYSNLNKGCLSVQHISIRRPKSKISDRVILLSQRPQELLRKHQDG